MGTKSSVRTQRHEESRQYWILLETGYAVCSSVYMRHPQEEKAEQGSPVGWDTSQPVSPWTSQFTLGQPFFPSLDIRRLRTVDQIQSGTFSKALGNVMRETFLWVGKNNILFLACLWSLLTRPHEMTFRNRERTILAVLEPVSCRPPVS